MSTAAKVALEKASHPERFCPVTKCLWRTSRLNHATGQREGGGYCPRHRPQQSTALQWIRSGFTFPGKRVPEFPA